MMAHAYKMTWIWAGAAPRSLLALASMSHPRRPNQEP